MKRVAAIDVGTNSVLLLVVEETPDGIRTVLDRSAVTRLGEGLAHSGRIAPAAADRTAAALARYLAEARGLGADPIRAVGTMGLRQAANAADFLARVQDELGLSIEVISGEEEARLTWRGVVGDLPVPAERLTVFDPGGGSTEFMWGTPKTLTDRFSLELGVVSLTERFGLAEAAAAAAVVAARAHIGQTLAGPLARIPPSETLVAVGGTATTLAALRYGLSSYDPARVHGTVFSRAELEAESDRLLALSANARAALPGMEPRRADIIPAGCLLLSAVLGLLGQNELVVSDRGLRHGLIGEMTAERSATGRRA